MHQTPQYIGFEAIVFNLYSFTETSSLKMRAKSSNRWEQITLHYLSEPAWRVTCVSAIMSQPCEVLLFNSANLLFRLHLHLDDSG